MIHKFLFWLTNGMKFRTIHNHDGPYLERYFLYEGKHFSIFLHRFVSEDEEEWLHNHPWKHCFAIVLTGNYLEEVLRYFCPTEGMMVKKRRVRFFNYIGKGKLHRITKPKSNTWTLFFHSASKGKGDWLFAEEATIHKHNKSFILHQPFKTQSNEYKQGREIATPTNRHPV